MASQLNSTPLQQLLNQDYSSIIDELFEIVKKINFLNAEQETNIRQNISGLIQQTEISTFNSVSISAFLEELEKTQDIGDENPIVSENIKTKIISSIQRFITYEAFKKTKLFINLSSNTEQSQDIDRYKNLLAALDKHFIMDMESELTPMSWSEYHGELNPTHHGEFAHAILLLLNRQKLSLTQNDQNDSYFQLATTLERADYFSRESLVGTSISWGNSSPFTIDTELPKRLDVFKTQIDSAIIDEPPHIALEKNKNWSEEAFTLAVWNKNWEREGGAALRGTNVEFISALCENIQSNLKSRNKINILLLGDAVDVNKYAVDFEEKNMGFCDATDKHYKDNNGQYLAKDEQVKALRKIIKDICPNLIVGPRAGLMALCAMTGVPAIQINQEIVTRKSSLKTKKPKERRGAYSQCSSPKIASIDGGDARLRQVFLRCPVDGLGPHINLFVESLSQFKKTKLTADSSAMFEILSVAMLAKNKLFKHLILSAFANFLVNATEENEVMLHFLFDQYKKHHLINVNENNAADISIEDSPGSGGGGSFYKGNEYPDNNSRHHKNYKPGNSNINKSNNSSHQNNNSCYRNYTNSSFEELNGDNIVVNEINFFEDLNANKQERKNQFSQFTRLDKFKIAEQAVLIEEIANLQLFFNEIVPDAKALLKSYNFSLLQSALSDSDEFKFLVSVLDEDSYYEFLNNDSALILRQVASLDDVEAKNLWTYFASKLEKEKWHQLLATDAFALLRTMADEKGVAYAWNFYSHLNESEKVKAISADNYLILRLAAEDCSHFLLFKEMFLLLSENEKIEASNCLDGDLFFAGLSNTHSHLFCAMVVKYLNNETKTLIIRRIESTNPSLMNDFERHITNEEKKQANHPAAADAIQEVIEEFKRKGNLFFKPINDFIQSERISNPILEVASIESNASSFVSAEEEKQSLDLFLAHMKINFASSLKIMPDYQRYELLFTIIPQLVENGDADGVSLLLEIMEQTENALSATRSIYEVKFNNKTLVQIALVNNHKDIANFILNRVRDKTAPVVHSEYINVMLNTGKYALISEDEISAHFSNLEKEKREINIQDEEGRTKLFNAAAQGNLVLVKQLIAIGADITIKDNQNYSPLGISLKNGHQDVHLYLLSKFTAKNLHSNVEQTKKSTKKVKKKNKADAANDVIVTGQHSFFRQDSSSPDLAQIASFHKSKKNNEKSATAIFNK